MQVKSAWCRGAQITITSVITFIQVFLQLGHLNQSVQGNVMPQPHCGWPSLQARGGGGLSVSGQADTTAGKPGMMGCRCGEWQRDISPPAPSGPRAPSFPKAWDRAGGICGMAKPSSASILCSDPRGRHGAFLGSVSVLRSPFPPDYTLCLSCRGVL